LSKIGRKRALSEARAQELRRRWTLLMWVQQYRLAALCREFKLSATAVLAYCKTPADQTPAVNGSASGTHNVGRKPLLCPQEIVRLRVLRALYLYVIRHHGMAVLCRDYALSPGSIRAYALNTHKPERATRDVREAA